VSGVHVRGSAFLSTRQFLVESFGPSGLEDVLACVPPPVRELTRSRLDPSVWYPFETWITVSEVADRVLGKGDLSLCRRMGHYSGLRDLGTAYRQIFSSADNAAALLRYAKQFWGLYFDTGRVEIEDEAPGRFDLLLHDFGSPHLGHCLRVAGWIDASIELFKASGNVDIASCRALGHEECRFRASWTFPPPRLR